MAKVKGKEKVRPEGVMAGKVPQIMQMEALECGAACLAMICAYYDKWIPLAKIRSDCGVGRDGARASALLKTARAYGFSADAYRFEPERLREKAVFPCIIHWNFTHYVVLRGFKRGKAYIHDPARGACTVDMETFDRCFTGVCLQVVPGEAFESEGKPASLIDFIKGHLGGTRSALVFITLATLLTSLAALMNPVLSQVFMTRILGGNTRWFLPFACVLFVVCAMQVISSGMSTLCLLRTEGKLAVRTGADYVWKLLHLPLGFFWQRSAGDLVSRYSSNQNIAKTMIEGLTPLIINSGMLIIDLVIMVKYSPFLSIIGIASTLVNVFVARSVARKRTDIARVSQRDQGNLQAATVAGIKMIETIKASGAESGVFKRWGGYQAAAFAQLTKNARLNATLGAVPAMTSSIANALVIVFGVELIMFGKFTVGMVLAFQGFLQQFAAPAESLISSMQTFTQMRADMERLQDVMQYQDDPLYQAPTVAADPVRLKGDLEIKNVTFGYSGMNEPLIKNLSFHVRPGKCIAFVGASGSGKSTLAMVCSGLYQPWSGEVLLDGKPFLEVPRETVTRSLSVVDQNVNLLGDTIGNNIRLWDDSIPESRLEQAASDACILDDILQKDKGFDHILADGGRDLSGGQRQRIEIARALVTDPSILIMDEATSALDARTEELLMRAVRKRGITLILIAHRLSTIRDADEILVLDHGQVAERGNHEELMAENGIYAHLVAEG